MGAACAQVRMDEYEVIKCINFIRTCVSQGNDPRSELAGALSTPEKPWKDDKYLIPVLPDDAMLFHEFGSSMGLPPASASRSGHANCKSKACCLSCAKCLYAMSVVFPTSSAHPSSVHLRVSIKIRVLSGGHQPGTCAGRKRPLQLHRKPRRCSS